jgi:hypothetical protein
MGRAMRNRIVFAFGLLLVSVNASAYAVKCRVHSGGNGCNGPVVYEIQLCSKASINGGKCSSLCQEMRPICNVSDFDAWITAYNSGGFLSGQLGKNGYKGDLSQAVNTESFDQNGQLAYTSSGNFSVCISTAPLLFGFSAEQPTTFGTASCPKAINPSPGNCAAGTIFNNDPVHPQCVTQDASSSANGATGSYAGTMSAGFQMVAVENQHFVVTPNEGSNLGSNAATAGTVLPGLTAPTLPSTTAATSGGSTGSTFHSAGSGGATASTGLGIGAGGTTIASADPGAAKAGAGNTSDFASKDFAMDAASAGTTAGVGASLAGSGSATGSGGASWFGAGAAATAGAASGDVGFDSKDAAARGLASDGRLQVEDPANYFMLSDVETSLFKRVTAQCRKKERSLVLAPLPGKLPLSDAR